MKLILGVATGQGKSAKVQVTRPGPQTNEATIWGAVVTEIEVAAGDVVSLEVLDITEEPSGR